MGYYVYILRCSDGSYYTGHSDQIEARLAAHQSGKFPGYTYERRPVELAFLEEMSSRDDAFRRERQIKGWSRAKKEALMAQNWEQLVRLSRSTVYVSKLT
jgi:tRNA/rRNA methyltransferase